MQELQLPGLQTTLCPKFHNGPALLKRPICTCRLTHTRSIMRSSVWYRSGPSTLGFCGVKSSAAVRFSKPRQAG